jgi:hypothetical protein
MGRNFRQALELPSSSLFDSIHPCHPNSFHLSIKWLVEREENRGQPLQKLKSSPSSDSEAIEEASPIAQCTRKRKAIAKVPQRSHGHGRPNPQGTLGQGTRPRIKCVSAPGSHMEHAGESLEYLEWIIIRMQPPIRQTHPQYKGTCPVDYMSHPKIFNFRM